MMTDPNSGDEFRDAEEQLSISEAQDEVAVEDLMAEDDSTESNIADKKNKKKNKKKGNAGEESTNDDATNEVPDVPDGEESVEEVPEKEVPAGEVSIESAVNDSTPMTADLEERSDPVEPLPTAVDSHPETQDELPLGESTEPFEQSEELERSNKALEDRLKLLVVDDDLEVAASKDQMVGDDEPGVQGLSSPLQSHRSPETGNEELHPVLPPRAAPCESQNAQAPSLPPRDAPSEAAQPPSLPPREETPPPPLPERHHELKSHEQLFKTAAELPPPPLPPQLSRHQKAQHRNTISSWFQKSVGSSAGSGSEKSEVEYDENYDLLLSRLHENHEDLSAKDNVSKEQINSTHDTLRSSFADKVSRLEGETTADDSELKIDWPFWTQVVNDYPSVVKSEPSRLAKELANGIPDQIRSIVWQLVSNSNPQEFSEQYEQLKSQDSKFEKNIQKDLSRTSFITTLGLDHNSLYNVIKAYSNLDTEVGYTQGMAFITVPLLINVTELEAFSLLHKLMYGYDARSLYLPEMNGLLLKLYQFDRLVEDLLPNLYNHFQRQGIRSSMYATQWFLTFFAYKFPLEFVLRIFDLIITEGIESILKFAVALVQKNEERLLALKFDDLLSFLKDSLFGAYRKNPLEDEDEDDKPAPITVDLYNVDGFIEDATNVKLLPITLKRYESEWTEIHREEKERREEVDQLKLRNTHLRKEIRSVEASYTILNREHVQIANEMIAGRMKLAELEDANKDLQEQNQNLRTMVKSLQENPISENVPIPAAFEADLKRTMERNLEVMSQNQELEDQVQNLLHEIEDLKAKLKTYEEKPEEEEQVPSPTRAHGGWTRKLFK
jgi:hypothetical protein